MSNRLNDKKNTGSQNQQSKAQPNKLKPNKPLAKKTQASKNQAKNSQTKKLNSQNFALSSTAFSVCVALSSYALPSIINPAFAAGPKGGVVVSGSGSITKDAAETIIKQNSQHMAINWDSYNVASNERVQYIQPNSQSVSLNNILSSNGSVIAGNIDANGKVILVNPNGIVFTQSSTLNVGSLVASGLSITPDDFINGNYVFDAFENADGAVINHGIINAATGGSVTLLGKQVENHGYISANLGAVNLAVGKQAILTFEAGGLLGVSITDAILQDELGLDPALVNSGEITAKGGRVLLTASVSQDVFSQAVNSGIESASSVVMHADGSFTLGGGADVLNTGTIDVSINESVDSFLLDELKQANETFDLSSNTTSSKIVILGDNITSSGQLLANTSYANGTNTTKPSGEIELHAQNTTLLTENSQTLATSANGIGGIVKVLGDKVGLLNNSVVDVSGDIGGGGIFIGGDYLGENDLIRNATASFIAGNTQISANAINEGDGGRIIIWGNDSAKVYGNISATGGFIRGDGGFVETSAGVVSLDLTVDVSAANGNAGAWLIDPYNITMSNADGSNFNETDPDPVDGVDVDAMFTNDGGDSNINLSTLLTALDNGGNVTIRTSESGSTTEADVVFDGDGNITTAGSGNITLVDDFDLHTKDGAVSTLTLEAHNDININGKIYDSEFNNDPVHLTLTADYDKDNQGDVTAIANIQTSGGDFTATGVSITLAEVTTLGFEGWSNSLQGSAGGAILLQASTGSVETGALTTQGGEAYNRNGHAAGNITIEAVTGITVTGAINAQGSVGGDKDTGGSGYDGGAGGIVKLTSAGGDIDLENTVNSSGGNGHTAENDHEASGGNAGAITIEATTGSVTLAAVSSDGGDADGKDPSNDHIAGNAAVITLIGTSIMLEGNLSAKGGNDPDANTKVLGTGANVILNGAVTLANNITIDATGSTDGDICFTDDCAIPGTTSTINGSVAHAQNLTLLGKDIIFTDNLGDIFTLGDLKVTATGAVTATNVNITSASLNVVSSTDFTSGNITTVIDGQNGGDIIINAINLDVSDIDTSSTSNDGGSVTLKVSNSSTNDGASIIIDSIDSSGSRDGGVINLSVTDTELGNANLQASGTIDSSGSRNGGTITLAVVDSGAGNASIDVQGLNSSGTNDGRAINISAIDNDDGKVIISLQALNSLGINRAGDIDVTAEDNGVGATSGSVITLAGDINSEGVNISKTGAVNISLKGENQGTVALTYDHSGTNTNSFTSSVIVTSTTAVTTDILIGADRTNAWVINATNTTLNTNLTALGFANLTGGSEVDNFTLALMDNITGLISGGAGLDTLKLTTASQSVVIGTDISAIETVTAFDTDNTLTASNIVNSWLVTGDNQGVINNATADEVNFVNFNKLTGGTGNDDFVMDVAGNINTLVGGGGAGVDSLSARTNVTNIWAFTDALSSLTQDNDPAADELYVGDFSGIETYITGKDNEWADVSALTTNINVSSFLDFAGIVGNNLTSTLLGQDIASTWTIGKVKDANDNDSLGINDGTYTAGAESLKFIGFANLTGGDKVDEFILSKMDDITGLISGGA
ncbi:hypothetical protein CXF85_12045, partial [Colwellia sp. 75C3]|uniref:beta strand repeat-containing protein n=1 Tax=Colwellia sp. 75C3 TaxID=888425 RepID=UPI000CAA836C